ncbi:uncharacterized protein LOC106868443 isoform X3 [Octopus bimaculoides]|uniref:Uncharacterized protein n=1 Tax=Octopus bimaculoides TaxID=37653 RepID=A0A0L8HUW4_OCTBM|nr:uncharacterized protein LOC106868443 isoform X3 [Octopus bimaculoides]XP_052827858.1 uncharacterized protein LOC106868443 isoform X3 [Octopus bimaculoides]
MMADRNTDHLHSTNVADRDNAFRQQVVIQVSTQLPESRSCSPYFRKDPNDIIQQECGSDQLAISNFKAILPPGQNNIYMASSSPKSNNQKVSSISPPYPVLLGHPSYSSLKSQPQGNKLLTLSSKAPSPGSINSSSHSISPVRNPSPVQLQLVTNNNNLSSCENVAYGNNLLQLKRTQSPALIQTLLQNRDPSPNQRLSSTIVNVAPEGFQQKILVTPSVSPNRVVGTDQSCEGSSTILITADPNPIINKVTQPQVTYVKTTPIAVSSPEPSRTTPVTYSQMQPTTQVFYMKSTSPNMPQLSSQLQVQPFQGMQIKQDQLILNSIIVDKSQTSTDKNVTSLQGSQPLLLSVPKSTEQEQTILGNELEFRQPIYNSSLTTSQPATSSLSSLDRLTLPTCHSNEDKTLSTTVQSVSAISQAPILAQRLAAPSVNNTIFSSQLTSSRLVLPSSGSAVLPTGLANTPNIQLIPTSTNLTNNSSQLNILSVQNNRLSALSSTENSSFLQHASPTQISSIENEPRGKFLVSNAALNVQPAMVTSNPQLAPSITERLPVSNASMTGNTGLMASQLHPTFVDRLSMTNKDNAVTYSTVVVTTPQFITAPTNTMRSDLTNVSAVKSILAAQNISSNLNPAANNSIFKIITPTVGVSQQPSTQAPKLVLTEPPESSLLNSSLNQRFQANQTAMLLNTNNSGQHNFAQIKDNMQPQIISFNPVSFEIPAESFRFIEMQGQPLKTTSSNIINNTVTNNISVDKPINIVTRTDSGNVMNPSNIFVVSSASETSVQSSTSVSTKSNENINSELQSTSKLPPLENKLYVEENNPSVTQKETAFSFRALPVKDSPAEPVKPKRPVRKKKDDDDVNPFFAHLRVSSASLSNQGGLPPFNTLQTTSEETKTKQSFSEIKNILHSKTVDDQTNFQSTSRGLNKNTFNQSNNTKETSDPLDSCLKASSSDNQLNQKCIDKDNHTEEEKSSETDDNTERKPIPKPFSMRLQTLNNFPVSQAYKSTFRCHAAAISRAKVACITSSTKSLDLIRQNLQRFINKEIDHVIQDYLKKFFNPGIENIRFNNGLNAVKDEHVQSVCQKILEEAKKMYVPDRQNIKYDKAPVENVSELTTAGSSKRSTFNRKRRSSDTDSDIALPVQKKKKKGRPPTHSGRVTPQKSIRSVEPLKREGPKWDPERLISETLFVMGARANKALGFGATRGRLYIKHPELFKYSGDQDDKQWLFDNHHMPAIGGKAYILLYNDIENLANTDEYRENPNVILNELVLFKVPLWMLEKMKIQMNALRTDLPKTKTPSINNIHSNDTIISLTKEVQPAVIQSSSSTEVLASKLPFTRFLYDDSIKPVCETPPENNDMFEILSMDNDTQETDVSPFVPGPIGAEGPSPSISDLDGLDENTTSISSPFQLTTSDPNG